MSIKLDSAGIAQILKSTEMHRVVQEATERVAGAVEAQQIKVGAHQGKGTIDLPVKVEVTTTDRARGTVLLAHPAGEAVQAKHGALTKAAAAAGLTVKTGKG